MPGGKKTPESLKKGIREMATSGKIKRPDMAELTAHFFEIAGGPRAVARMLYSEYVNAPEGSVVRQRILDMILRAAKFLEERQPPAVEDLSLLSEEDLEAELNRVLTQMGEADGEERAQEDQRDTRPAGDDQLAAGPGHAPPAGADPAAGAGPPPAAAAPPRGAGPGS